MSLREYSSLEMLAEILRREGTLRAPKFRQFSETCREAYVAIGTSENVFITLPVEGVDQLEELYGVSIQ